MLFHFFSDRQTDTRAHICVFVWAIIATGFNFVFLPSELLFRSLKKDSNFFYKLQDKRIA